MEYKIDYDVRMGIIINPYLMYGIMAGLCLKVCRLPTYRIWLEYVFRGKGVDREEAASFAAGCIKRLAEPLLDAGYGIEKILCYREEFDWP